jgi:hypothetical protein
MAKEFDQLYKKDQEIIAKFQKGIYTEKQTYKKNKILIKELEILLRKKSLKRGKDYFITAMIFHHACELNYSRKAIKFAKLAIEKGYNQGKWLIASTTDRLLQLQNKPQKFGTQVENMSAKKLKMYKLNPKTTDKERKRYGLPNLNYLKRYLNQK